MRLDRRVLAMDTKDPFLQSCVTFEHYPKNLVCHNVLRHSAQAYHDRLIEQSDRLFNERQAAVDFLDLNEGTQKYRPTCVSSIRELKFILREAFRPERKDPLCRLVFLHAPHSRAPLRISLSMLCLLFTYHQVMPSFLDFLFPYGKQMYPKDFHFSGLREESRFASQQADIGIPKLGRSGVGLRLCYNLRSVERSKDQPELPWSIRQTAVYHEFDLETGRALWIIVKGNKLIKSRMTEASASNHWNFDSKPSKAFSASLAPHLILCDWAGENWRWYINDLEDQLQAITRDVLAPRMEKRLGPLSSAVEPGQPRNHPSRSRTFSMLSRTKTDKSGTSSRATTGRFGVATRAGSFPIKFSSRASTLVSDSPTPCPVNVGCSRYGQQTSVGSVDTGRTRQRSAFSSYYSRIRSILNTTALWHGRKQQSTVTPDIEMDAPYVPRNDGPVGVDPLPRDNPKQTEGSHTFSNLQQIQYIEEKAQESLLVLKFNAEVLDELKKHYKHAASHPDFPEKLRKECQSDLDRFERCVSGVEKDLRMLQARTETLLCLLANRKKLLNDILQYRGNKQAQASADQMERMTRDMHEIAKKTKQETVSMRVITSVTLFFLPATFIATFMSTDILKFEHGESDFQVKGLRVYIAIALPLTVLTFAAWYIIYLYARRRDHPSTQGAEPGDNQRIA